MASLVVLCFMNLPSFRTVLQIYSMKHFGLPLQTENQELIWLKFYKFPRFNNSKGNGIVGRKLVRPVIPCRVWIWPATGERLPIPGGEGWQSQLQPLPPAMVNEADYDAWKTAYHRLPFWHLFSSISTSLTCQLLSPESVYADDLEIMHADGDWQAVEGVLSKDMETVDEYLRTWKLKLSTTKTVSTVFHLKEAKP